MTLKQIKAALVAAHRACDWESAKALSQEKEKLKRSIKPHCVDCGVVIHKKGNRSRDRCRMHYIIHRFYPRSIGNAL